MRTTKKASAFWLRLAWAMAWLLSQGSAQALIGAGVDLVVQGHTQRVR
jgi:hypothetical protein